MAIHLMTLSFQVHVSIQQSQISCFASELHGFADASRLGYACAVYIRVVYTDGTISTALVYSKTKVAPLKSITIPKLELSGALLLARTLTHVAEMLELFVTEAPVWTDSAIVLLVANNTRKAKNL